MKISSSLTFLLLLSTACVSNEGDSPLRVMNVTGFDSSKDRDCTLGEGPKLLGGAYDLAGARQVGASAVNYLATYELQNDLQALRTTTRGEPLADESRNDIIVNELAFSYASTPSIALDPEVVTTYFVLEPRSTDNQMLTSLIGPTAGQKLLDNVAAGNVTELTVTLEVRGTLRQDGTTVVSAPVDFPISVYDSGRTCPSGTFLDNNGPCGNIGGQDGFPVRCLGLDAGTP